MTLEYELNFFVVPLPDQQLPFLTRPLDQSDTLGSDERLWIPEADLDPKRRLAVCVGRNLNAKAYNVDRLSVHDMQPSIVKSLLEVGLIAALEASGRHVERRKLTFACFHLSESLPSVAPRILALHRGVEFRVDHFVNRGHRSYGFFASTRVRQSFLITLADSALAAAATRQVVEFNVDGVTRSGTLLEAKITDDLAIVEDKAGALTVPLDKVRVPASWPVLERYFQITGQPGLAQAAGTAAQVQSYRLLPDGRKNRRWLRQQYEQVRAWMVMASHNGRLHLTWPNSDQALYLDLRPAQARERGAQ